MANAHNINYAMGEAVRLGFALGLNPGSGGTLDLKGKNKCCFILSAGTYKLPNSTAFTEVMVLATGAVNLTNVAGTAVVSLVSGDVVTAVAKTSSTWGVNSSTRGSATTGTITVPLMSITGETGVVLAAQSSTTSGWTQLANKNIVLNIPVNATNEAFSFSTSVPSDLDITQPVYVDVMATKAADNDALTLDCELYAATPADGVGADLVTTSAQTIEEDGSMGPFTCSAPGVSAYAFGGVLTLGGTNDGDAVYIHGVRIRYTKT